MGETIYKLYLYIGIMGFIYVPLTVILATIRKHKYRRFFRNTFLMILFFVQAALYTGLYFYRETAAGNDSASVFVYMIMAGALSFAYAMVQMIDLLFCSQKMKKEAESPRIRL
ncbi:MAG TPA: hypothetical protein GX726_04030 [Clostridiales bacterium]|jgi:hypothetical protein|nr:hypothetical protein [Clostridiales bacterium]